MKKNIAFSDRLKTLRKEKNLTQKVLASDLGLVQSAIANYENGNRFPDEKTLRKLSLYFNTSLDYLLNVKDIVVDKRDENIDFNNIYEMYRDYMLSKDFARALNYLLTCQQKGLELIEIFEKIIVPLLDYTGSLWEESLITVADEHLITEEVEKSIGIISHYYQLKNEKGIKCVCATAGIEMHRIPLRMISELLNIEGYNVSFLGVNTPGKEIIDYCKKINADYLLISAIMDISLDAVNNLIIDIRNDKKLNSCKVVVGGAAFNRNPKAWKLLNADFVGRSVKETVQIINYPHQYHQ